MVGNGGQDEGKRMVTVSLFSSHHNIDMKLIDWMRKVGHRPNHLSRRNPIKGRSISSLPITPVDVGEVLITSSCRIGGLDPTSRYRYRSTALKIFFASSSSSLTCIRSSTTSNPGRKLAETHMFHV